MAALARHSNEPLQCLKKIHRYYQAARFALDRTWQLVNCGDPVIHYLLHCMPEQLCFDDLGAVNMLGSNSRTYDNTLKNITCKYWHVGGMDEPHNINTSYNWQTDIKVDLFLTRHTKTDLDPSTSRKCSGAGHTRHSISVLKKGAFYTWNPVTQTM